MITPSSILFRLLFVLALVFAGRQALRLPPTAPRP